MPDTEGLICTWKSRNCDDEHPIELYFYHSSQQPMCRFHGQAWPRVGESEVDAKKRTKRARELLTYRGRKDGKKDPFIGAVIPGHHYRET